MNKILYTGLFFRDNELKRLNAYRKHFMRYYSITDEGRNLDEFHATIEFKPKDLSNTLEFKKLKNLNITINCFGINPEGCIALSGYLTEDRTKQVHITLWCSNSCTPVKSNQIKNWKRFEAIEFESYLGYMSENKWIVEL